MLCQFTQVANKWICKRCGRISSVEETDKFSPSAKCRIPDNYHLQSNYIWNQRINGVGDTLSAIFKQLGFKYSPMGDARARITFLNKRSINWCRKHSDVIYSWIKEECDNKNIPINKKLGHALIRLAIIKTSFPSFAKP